MTVAKSILLFAIAAVFEIGGAWLFWQGVREHRGWIWAGLGVIASGAYGFVATFQPDAQFGRVLAAYGWDVRWHGAWHWTDFGRTGGTSSAPRYDWPASG